MEELRITKGKLTYEQSPFHSVSYEGVFCFCNDITVDNSGEKAGLIMEYCHIDGKENAKVLVHFTDLKYGTGSEKGTYHTPTGYNGVSATFTPFYWDRNIMSAISELFRLIVKEIRVRNAVDMIDFTKPTNEELNIWRVKPAFIEKVLEVPFPSYLKIAMEDEANQPSIIDGEHELLEDEPIPVLRMRRTIQLIEAAPACYLFRISDNGKADAHFFAVRQGLCIVDFPDTIYKVHQVCGNAYQITAKSIGGNWEDPLGLVIRLGDIVIHDPGCPLRIQED